MRDWVYKAGVIYKSAVPYSILRKRADFVALRGRHVVHTKGFVLQWQQLAGAAEVKVGFTATKKKVGNAVQRNRAKRRLRAVVDRLVRLNPDFSCACALRLNLIARQSVLTLPFAQLEQELRQALEQLPCKI